MDNSFSKIVSFDKLSAYFHDKMTIMFGGFGGIGTPPTLIDKILETGVKDLVLIGNDTGFPDIGIGRLITAKRARKVITSHIGSNPIAGELMEKGELEIEFSPQGTLSERIRAGGAGLGGVLTDVGKDHEIVSRNKPRVMLGGKEYLIESALTADVSIVFAKKGDPFGNLVYDKSARNTNPLVAMAGNLTIAEVEEMVPTGALDPDEIMTPGAFVDFICLSKGVNWEWAWE